MVSQLVTSKQETLDKTLEEILKDIGTQVLETKYIELRTIIVGNIPFYTQYHHNMFHLNL
jgi:hypothetical protein